MTVPSLPEAVDPEFALRSAAAGSAPQKREQRGFGLLFTLAQFGLIIATTAPITGGLSVRLQHLVGIDDAAAALGLITGVGALFALITPPIAGRLTDRTTSRFGMRRPWLVGGAILTAIASAAIGFVPSIPLILLAWCATQVFANVLQAALTVSVADQVPERRLGFISSLVGIATPAATVVAAVVLAAMPNDMTRALLPAVISVVFALPFGFLLKDRILTTPLPRFSWREVFATFYFNPRKSPDFGWVWAARFLVFFGYVGVQMFFTLFLGVNFGMSPDQQLELNLLFQVVAAALTLIVSIGGGKLSDRLQRRRPFVAGGGMMIALGVALILPTPFIGGVTGIAIIVVGQALMGAGFGLFLAVDAALAIDTLPNRAEAAKDLGVLNIAAALPQSLAPLFAASVVLPLGDAIAPTGGFPLWFAVAGSFALIGALLTYRIKNVR